MAQAGDYYAILGVPRDATTPDINKAFRTLALQWHPDKNKDNKDSAERMFKLVVEAHNVLGNPGRRQRYDVDLNKGSLPRSASGVIRAYYYTVPTYQKQAGAHESFSYVRDPMRQYPRYSVPRPNQPSRHPGAYGFTVHPPAHPQYAYNLSVGPYYTGESMSRSAAYLPGSYYPVSAAPSATMNPQASEATLPSTDYERQTSTRIVQGKRMDLELIKERDAEMVNVYENGVLTQSMFRRTSTI